MENVSHCYSDHTREEADDKGRGDIGLRSSGWRRIRRAGITGRLIRPTWFWRKRVCRGSFTGARAVSTAIYFLLEGENFSAFHRLRSDEVWHFYVGRDAGCCM